MYPTFSRCPSNRGRIILYQYAYGCCLHYPLGTSDNWVAGWMYEYPAGDRNEPTNDFFEGACYLGELYEAGEYVDNGWQDRMTGYVDVDIFSVNCGDGYYKQLCGTLSPGSGNAAMLAGIEVLYQDVAQRLVLSPGAGFDVDFAIPAMVGYWQFRVFTLDYKDTPSTYRLKVELRNAPTATADESLSTTLSLKVNSVTKLASGGALPRGGRLQLIDVGGRMIWERSISPTAPDWCQRIDAANLSAGIFFVRLSDGAGSKVERFVHLR